MLVSGYIEVSPASSKTSNWKEIWGQNCYHLLYLQCINLQKLWSWKARRRKSYIAEIPVSKYLEMSLRLSKTPIKILEYIIFKPIKMSVRSLRSKLLPHLVSAVRTTRAIPITILQEILEAMTHIEWRRFAKRQPSWQFCCAYHQRCCFFQNKLISSLSL